MLDQSSWHAIAVGGLVLSAIAGLTSGPIAAAAFTVLYGGAVLSILRIMLVGRPKVDPCLTGLARPLPVAR